MKKMLALTLGLMLSVLLVNNALVEAGEKIIVRLRFSASPPPARAERPYRMSSIRLWFLAPAGDCDYAQRAAPTADCDFARAGSGDDDDDDDRDDD